MLVPKIILLLTLSVLNISVYSQDTQTPASDTTQRKDTLSAALEKYLERNVNPNVPVDNGAPAGIYNVYVQYIISRDGSISDVKALTTFGYGMEAEVVRVLKKWGPWGGKWKPAPHPSTQKSNNNHTYGKHYFTFMVAAKGFTITTKVPYVLFTGIDNEISVEVDNVKTKDVKLIMEGGTILHAGNGKYIVRLSNESDSRIIEIYKKRKRKKPIGRARFEVRREKVYRD